MQYTLMDFFTDPVLRAPTLGSMFMCLASSLIGAVVVLRKRSLLGEALSHAAYPGVAIGVVLLSFFVSQIGDAFAFGILLSAFCSCLLGLGLIDLLQRVYKVKDDASLCFVLSSFFGFGILIASRIQSTHALWYKQIQVFLYGQAATMRDVHIYLYASLCIIVFLCFFLFYRTIASVLFDRTYASSIGLPVKRLELLLFFLLVLAIVVGIRSVGVVLMSGMLIIPCVAARQWTHRLSFLLILSSLFGGVSGFLGNYLSVMIPIWSSGPSPSFSLPTGPMILLVAAFFCLLSMLVAPKKGMLHKWKAVWLYKNEWAKQCMIKLLLVQVDEKGMTMQSMRKKLGLSFLFTRFALHQLVLQRDVQKRKGIYFLTESGRKKGEEIAHYHKIWQWYLLSLGQGKEKLHPTLDQMKKILTASLIQELVARYGEMRDHKGESRCSRPC